jgi:hypothetical protein
MCEETSIVSGFSAFFFDKRFTTSLSHDPWKIHPTGRAGSSFALSAEGLLYSGYRK